MENFLTIKNNISPKLVKRHLKRIADDEEAERAKRAAEYNRTFPYSSGNTNTPISVYIYFYEWSTLYGAMRTFTEYRTFFKFCADSNIAVTETDRQLLYNTYYAYVTCKKGKNELLISKTFCGLKEKLEAGDDVNKNVSCLLPARVNDRQPPIVMQYG